MRDWFISLSISKAAALNFALLIVPVSIVFVIVVLTLNREISEAMKNPIAYNFNTEMALEAGPVRRATHWLRSLGPSYQESDDITDFLRDTRLFLIMIWLGIVAMVSWVAISLAGRLQKQLLSVGEGINQLVDHDLSKPIAISGNRNVQDLGEQLETLRVRLEENEQQQIKFLSHVAHEIKTPLASIREGIKLVNDELLGEINTEQREVTEIISKNSRALQKSIESLLDYSAALSVKSLGERERLNLAHLIEQVLEDQALAIKAKSLKMELNLQDVPVMANQNQLLTALGNIVSNAIRFSPQSGTISIAVSRCEEAVIVMIQDDGPSVPESQRQLIFSAFYTGAAPDGNEIKGSGLGLSIARQYIELHRGALELLDSSVGTLKGAMFRVTLIHDD